MEVLHDLWHKTPPLPMSALYETGLVLAVYALLSDAHGGALFGVPAETIALALFFGLRPPGVAALRALAARMPGYSSVLVMALVFGPVLAALALSGPEVLALFCAAIGAAYLGCYVSALKGDVSPAQWAECFWLAHQGADRAGPAVLFWAFWHAVFWGVAVFVALSGSGMVALGMICLGAPIVAKLIDMTYLLKLWAD